MMARLVRTVMIRLKQGVVGTHCENLSRGVKGFEAKEVAVGALVSCGEPSRK